MRPTQPGPRTIPVVLALAAIAGVAPIPARAQTVSVRPALPEVNARAEQRLRGLFAARNESDTQLLFSGGSLICGPFLWKNMSGVPELQGKGADFRFFVKPSASGGRPSLSSGAAGRMFNTRPTIDVFRGAFLALYPADAKARIRKLQPAELQLFASMLPFAPQEPLFVVETGKHKFVVRMDDKLRIAWIDDYFDRA
jgi:hypothetical protein